MGLVDSFGRRIDYIRISVTKVCNFRCQYCMPNTPPNLIDKSALPLNKMLEFVKIAIDLGVKKIRITGGEPLLRADLSEFIKGIVDYKNDIEIALTTNGFLLSKYAKSLRESGISRINISLDSLNESTIEKISQKNALKQILQGIESAINNNLAIKLNMVPLKGINDAEILDLLDFAMEHQVMLRFIEFMENTHANTQIKGLTQEQILQIISKKYEFKQLQKELFGPARIYEIINAKYAKSNNKIHLNTQKKALEKNYAFGIISPHDDDFCKSCNRIRLTSDGIICPCLYYQDSVDVKEAILQCDKQKMKELLLLSIRNKPEKNQWSTQAPNHSARAFYYTGG